MGFIEDFILCGLHELDLLAALLLKGGDDFPDRLVLLGVEPLLPPHHEVGGPGSQWRREKCNSHEHGSAAHL